MIPFLCALASHVSQTGAVSLQSTPWGSLHEPLLRAKVASALSARQRGGHVSVATAQGLVYIYRDEERPDELCYSWGGEDDGVEACATTMPDGKTAPSFQYIRLMAQLAATAAEARKILLLGLGAGVLLTAVQKIHPQAQIDVVEIDEAIVTLALEGFGLVPSPKTHLFVTDAAQFVQLFVQQNAHNSSGNINCESNSIINSSENSSSNSSGSCIVSAEEDRYDSTLYDIILVDVFDQVSVPPQLRTSSFVENLADVLSPDTGTMIMNVDDEHLDLFQRLLRHRFRRVNSTGILAEDQGNGLLVAKRPIGSSLTSSEAYEVPLDVDG